MKDYEANDLKSVLFYIKNRFGLEIFLEQCRLNALFSDLAPNLKAEGRMLERLLYLGILEDLITSLKKDMNTRYLTVRKVLTKLIDDEYIQPEIAQKYIGIIVEVMEIGIPSEVSVSRLDSAEVMKVDVFTYEETKVNVEVEIPNKIFAKVSVHCRESKVRGFYSSFTSFLKRLLTKLHLDYFTRKVYLLVHSFIRAFKVSIIIILGFSGTIFGYLSILFIFNKFMTWLVTITPANSGFFKSFIAIVLAILGFVPQMVINIPFSVLNLIYYLFTGDWLSAPGLDGYSGFFF